MSEKNIVDQIKHYQRDIDRCPHKSDRMIRCIQRLCVIPVTVQHLQETGIGRSVNSLRKYGGETADAAKALVTKWKAMVAAEESSEDDAEKDELPLEKSEDNLNSLNPYQTLVSNNEKSPKTGQENLCNNNLRDSQLTDKTSNKMMKKSRSFSQSTPEFKSSSKNVPNTKIHSKNDSTSKICNSFDNKNERSKGLEIQNHKSNLNIKSNSKCDDHKIHSVNKSLSSDTKSSHKINYDEHNSKSDHKINLKENNKHKDKNHTLKKKHDDKLKTEHSKKHEGKSKQFNLSEEKKRHHQDSSDDESLSIKKKRENPASGKTYIHSLKKKIKIEEESCNENEAESLSEIDEDVRSQSSASSDNKRKKSSDSENESMENSTEGSNDESNGSNSRSHSSRSCCSSGSSDNNDSDNVENDQSNQTSDSENSSDSFSSHDSEHQNKLKKSLKKTEHHLKKSSVSDRHTHFKESHTDEYKNKTTKCNSSKKSNHNKEYPIKIKQEKLDDIEIKKEKSTKTDKLVLAKLKDNKSLTHSEFKISSKQKNATKEVALKPIKIEKSSDGSIDSGSGASFADALLGMSGTPLKSSKKKNTSIPLCKTSLLSSPKDSSNNTKKSEAKNSTELNLLKKNIKLEPLDINLAATLPEISPHYRPLPHYSPPSSPVMKKPKTITQEEALVSIMSTKNQRTKVFSGNKCAGMTAVPSLFDFCIQVLRENIDALEYTGGVPFEVLKPVLDRATADQLYQLEHYNPYLIEDTDGLWAFHCNKDFRGKRREDLESWRDLYLRCLDEREQKLKALTANISQSIAKSTPVRQTKLAYVDSIVKPPRNIARKQAKYGTASSSKHDILAKAIVGSCNNSSSHALATDIVPAPSRSSLISSAGLIAQNNILKKKKAPLMAKALQLIKGNRFKR